MQRTPLFVILISALTACDAVPSAPTTQAVLTKPTWVVPSFAKVVNEWIRDVPAEGLFNPCPPQEFIAATVSLHLVVTEEQGRIKVHQNTSSNVRGVGLTSGDLYTGHSNRKFDGMVVDGTETFEFVDHFRLIRQGSEDNFDFFAVFRVTILPTGETTVELVRLRSAECRG
jgi:hypothetical protein